MVLKQILCAAVLVLVFLASGLVEAQDRTYDGELGAAQEQWKKLVAERRGLWEMRQEAARRNWRDVLESSRSEWVEYDESGASYFSIDFDAGAIELRAVDDGRGFNAVMEVLEERLKRVLAVPGMGGDPLLEGQLEGTRSVPEPTAEPEAYVRDMLETVDIAGMVGGGDGVSRQSYVVRLEMLPDHIERRAEQFSRLVHLWSGRFEQDPALVFAIIQSESFFNPAAVSSAGAIGLMQLMPETGGLQASSYVLDRQQVPTEEMLYDPRINIALGIGYMKWMTDNYFGGSLDQGEIYQLVCSYNCGPGRVRRIMETSGVSVDSPDDVYAVLHENVPAETREYLDRVVSKWHMYQDALAG